MGTALVMMRIMPESPQANLEKMQSEINRIVSENGGDNPNTKTEPVAFGLNAIILQFAIDESKEIEPIENLIREVPQVSSAEVTDFRRAFG